MKRLVIKAILFLLLFLSGGAIINIAVAWGCFPGQPDDWSVVEQHSNVDQSHLVELGAPRYETVDSEVFRSFGFLDRDYSTFIDPEINKYQFGYAREIFCGWPLYSLHGIRWDRISFDDVLRRHVFTKKHVRITAIHLCGDKIVLGEREFLPYGPLWPGFLLNTVFYATILWLLSSMPLVLRRWRRVKRGLCPKCAYPVSTSDTCTECGRPVPIRGNKK